MEFQNTEKEPTWTLLALEEGAWVELSESYSSEEDALHALRVAEKAAEQDDHAPFQHFAIMRDDADVFPPAPAN